MSIDNPAEGSNRIRVREARVEYGPNGGERLRYSWRTRDRSEPPSLREVHAALAPYFKLRSWTPEQHRAVIDVLAARCHGAPLGTGVRLGAEAPMASVNIGNIRALAGPG